jgi:Hemagglutinin repeat
LQFRIFTGFIFLSHKSLSRVLITLVAIVGGVTASASVGVNASKSSSSSSETTQVNTAVTAGKTLNIVTGRDATLMGAVATGKDVVASIGRDLNIVSVQDVATSKSSSGGFSAGLTLAPVVGIGANGSVNVGKGSASSAIVAEQSALIAQGGSLTATVVGNTDLKGGVIAALDAGGKDSGKLNLATGTLTASDIKDAAKSTDISVGISASVNNVTDTKTRGANLPVIDGSYASSIYKQDTKATIGQGVVSVAIPGANVTINRDIGASQVVTKESQTGFTVYIDPAAIKEVVALAKGDTKNSVILQGVEEIGKDVDGDDTTRSDIAQDIRNAATDIKTRRANAAADKAQEEASKNADGDPDILSEAAEVRLAEETQAESIRLEQRTADALIDELDRSLKGEAREAEIAKIRQTVKESIYSPETQKTIRNRIMVSDVHQASKRDANGQGLSDAELARLTAVTSDYDPNAEIVVTGYAEAIKRANGGLIKEIGRTVGTVNQAGGGTVEGVGTGVLNNAKDTYELLRDATGYLVNKATFGVTNKDAAARTESRVDAAIQFGKAAVRDPVETANALGESFAKPFVEGAEKLRSGKTYDGTAQISEALSDTIVDAVSGGAKAAVKILAGGAPTIKVGLPKSKQPTIREHKAHHDGFVGDTHKYLESQGYVVNTEVSFGMCGVKGSCRTDILAKGKDGKYVVYEIKTGEGELSRRQSAIYPLIENGDAKPTGKIAKDLGLDPNLKLKDQGYPKGIPIIVQVFSGLVK